MKLGGRKGKEALVGDEVTNVFERERIVGSSDRSCVCQIVCNLILRDVRVSWNPFNIVIAAKVAKCLSNFVKEGVIAPNAPTFSKRAAS